MNIGEFIETIVNPEIEPYGFKFAGLGELDGLTVMYLKGFSTPFGVQAMFNAHQKGFPLGVIFKDALGKQS